MTLRTLRNWQRLDPADPAPVPGRPPLSEEALAEVRDAVRDELERQGWLTGEGPIHHALAGRYPISRVRRVLRELKAERQARARQHALDARVSVVVKARDVLWSMDATHLGRDRHGHAVQAEVVREVASTRTIGLSVGPAATSAEVLLLLQRVVCERGGAPLVLLTDNGGPYISEPLAAWCAQHGVVHLFSLPRTPQHNAASEHGMYELKFDTGLGKGARVHDIEDARALLEDARERVDGHRLRRTRDWKTAVDADRGMPHWSAVVTRTAFLAEVTCAIDTALTNLSSTRARRRAVREAILSTLESFSVIQRTRGGRSWTAQGAESVS
jgi:transposase InsO family protein